jgi:hypothetical protein
MASTRIDGVFFNDGRGHLRVAPVGGVFCACGSEVWDIARWEG